MNSCLMKKQYDQLRITLSGRELRCLSSYAYDPELVINVMEAQWRPFVGLTSSSSERLPNATHHQLLGTENLPR